MAFKNEKACLFSATNSFNLVNYSNKVLLKVWHQKHHFCHWPSITVPNITITNRESGIMTRALPTPTGKGIFFFHKSETYELICNYDSCWWVTHPHQRSIDRNDWPLTMYISEAFTNETCKKCGNITYISLMSNITFWQLILMDSCLGSLTEIWIIIYHLDHLK